jgi:hypothetical protein
MQTQPSILRTSPKNLRRPQARSLPLREAVAAVADEYERMSVRQLYYQLVARGVIPKTEAAYKRVCDVSAQMRLDGSLPYHKIADGHRSRRVIYAHGGLREALENAQEMYRRNYWLDQSVHVEVWCEKDALTGVIQPTCASYGVTYVATRGFPSITLRYESAMELVGIGKPATIFYFGDHDASGQRISANLKGELRQHGADVTVKRMALNPPQVRSYRLPTRLGKTSDSRHAKFAAEFGDASVELDALPPNILTRLVENAITSLIDRDAWMQTRRIEELERKTFESLAQIDWQAGKEYSIT